MNIILVTPSISRVGGGVSESVRLLTHSLIKSQEYQVEVVTLLDDGYHLDISDWGHVKVTAFKYYGPANFGFSPGLLFYLLRSRAGLAHVHGLWMFHCLAVLIWSVAKRRPYVVTPHGMLEAWILNRSRVLKRLVSLAFHNAFLQRASRFHVLTPKETEDVSLVLARAVCRIVPNFVPLQSRSTCLPAWWQPRFDDRHIFLFFGRIHEKKGCRELIEAWTAVCSGDCGFQSRAVLVFCGWLDGIGDFEQSVALARDLGMDVVFAGPQFGEQKLHSLSAASYLILPSKSEGLPMVVLEAWSLGVPVLMTDACNLSEGFSRGAGLRIGESAHDIGAGLVRALALSDFERHKMGECGRKFIEECYSFDSVSRLMKDVYAEATRGK